MRLQHAVSLLSLAVLALPSCALHGGGCTQIPKVPRPVQHNAPTRRRRRQGTDDLLSPRPAASETPAAFHSGGTIAGTHCHHPGGCAKRATYGLPTCDGNGRPVACAEHRVPTAHVDLNRKRCNHAEGCEGYAYYDAASPTAGLGDHAGEDVPPSIAGQEVRPLSHLYICMLCRRWLGWPL